jgi:hypothetical protein
MNNIATNTFKQLFDAKITGSSHPSGYNLINSPGIILGSKK